MRKGILGSIAAVAAGAGAAWGQPAAAADPPAPAAVAPAGDVIPAQGVGDLPGLGGPFHPTPPAPVIMPPLATGPQGDPQGLGPVAGFGPPPGPMYPNPGPYAAPMFQPPPGGGLGSGTSVGGAPHWWTTVDYLLYFAKDQPTRFPLLTTSAPSDRGLLGRPSTIILAGDEDFAYNAISGFRVGGGFFGDADRRHGFEAYGWLLEQKSKVIDIVSSPTGIPTLARPFIDSAAPAAAASLVVANPGLGSGRVAVATSTQTYSIEANSVTNLYRSEPGCNWAWSLDFLAGYRFLELEEVLRVESATTLNIPSVVTPTFAVGPFGILTQIGSTTTPVGTQVGGITVFSPGVVTVTDQFKVTNRFNGGQVGLRSELRYGMFTFAGTAKVAFGNMEERLEIDGRTTSVNRASNQVGGSFGGLLANASNIGTYTRNEFTYIPEFNLTLGLNISRTLTWNLGYNFLYIDEVARPGSQINPRVNSATVPFSPNFGATNRPNVRQTLLVQDDFWLMGLNTGVTIRY